MDPLLIGGLLGGLLGGTQQTTTVTQTFGLNFNPTTVTNIGGGVSAYPTSDGLTQTPTATASVTSSPSAGLGGLGGFGGLGGLGAGGDNLQAVGTGARAGVAKPLFSNPLFLVALGGGALFLLGGKK